MGYSTDLTDFIAECRFEEAITEDPPPGPMLVEPELLEHTSP
jgi:hypothetical protein